MAAITKVAIVTGAGSGVGQATVLALLADGWKVALTCLGFERDRARINGMSRTGERHFGEAEGQTGPTLHAA